MVQKDLITVPYLTCTVRTRLLLHCIFCGCAVSDSCCPSWWCWCLCLYPAMGTAFVSVQGKLSTWESKLKLSENWWSRSEAECPDLYSLVVYEWNVQLLTHSHVLPCPLKFYLVGLCTQFREIKIPTRISTCTVHVINSIWYCLDCTDISHLCCVVVGGWADNRGTEERRVQEAACRVCRGDPGPTEQGGVPQLLCSLWSIAVCILPEFYGLPYMQLTACSTCTIVHV